MGTGPPTTELGDQYAFGPLQLLEVELQKCSIVDFVAYAVMKVVHEFHRLHLNK